MRITILARKERDVCDEVAAELAVRGHRVTITRLAGLVVDRRLLATDLVIQKSKRLPLLYAGALARSHGIPVVPDPWVSLRVRDRITCNDLMRRAGFLVPASHVGHAGALADALPASAYPLVLKERMGSGSAAVALLRDPDALRAQRGPGPVYVERYLAGEHYAVEFLEERVRAFRKEMADTTCLGRREAPVEPEIAALVGRYRAATGLPVGDLDLLREASTGRWWSIDPGTFPSYRDWPGIAPALVDALLAEAERQRPAGGA